MKADWTTPPDWKKSADYTPFSVKKSVKPCPKCGGSRNRPGQRYCRACHREYMREHRIIERKKIDDMRRALENRIDAIPIEQIAEIRHKQVSRLVRNDESNKAVNETLRCVDCGMWHPVSEFICGKVIYRRCRECRNKRANRYQTGSIERRLYRRLGQILVSAQTRNTTKSLVNDLTFDELMDMWRSQGGLCYYTGRPMVIEMGQHDSPSLDRLDPKVGYTKSNVVLCCHIVNLMKATMSVGVFVEMCHLVINHKAA